MGLSRHLRRWFAAALACSLLLTQLAVAAYVCPQERHEEERPAVMAGMPDCHGMGGDQTDPAQPALCKAHCSNDSQSASRAATPEFHVDAAIIGLLVRVIEPAALTPPRSFAAARSGPDRPPDALPIYLTLQVLRI